MAINLSKGQRIDVGLSQLKVGLGWDPNTLTGNDFDLDVSVFMLNERKKIPAEPYFVFYGNPESPDESVKHSGDERSGQASEGGDDESVLVDLDKVNSSITELLFIVTIHDFEARKQNFGQVRNAYIRICDRQNNDSEIAKYELDEDFSVESAVEFGRLYKRESKWRFEASGIGHKQDLAYFVTQYSKNIEV